MKLQYLDPGVAGDDNSGTPLPDVADIFNGNVDEFETEIYRLLGGASVGVLAAVGDSIVGYLPGIINEVIARHYNPNLYMLPAFQCSAPGRKSDFILSDMVPKLQAAITSTGIIPRGCIITSGQNDGVVRLDIAQASFANIVATHRAIKAMGIPAIAILGMLPDPKLKGDGRPQALDWLNSALRNYAAGQEGVRFINALPLVKDQTGRGEAQTQVINGNTVPASAVWWKAGVDATGAETVKEGLREQPGLGGIGSAGIDNEHLARFSGVLLGPAVAPWIRRIAPEMELPDLTPDPFDAARNPLGNYLGPLGLFYGTGGTINGTASPGVPAGWALNYDASHFGSNPVVPSIVVDSRGIRIATLTGSGQAPTGSGLISLETTLNRAAPGGDYLGAVRVRNIAAAGFAGRQFYAAGSYMGSAGGLHNILPGAQTYDELLRSLAPFGFENTFNGKLFKIEIGYVAGVPLSGSIGFYRAQLNRFA